MKWLAISLILLVATLLHSIADHGMGNAPTDHEEDQDW